MTSRELVKREYAKIVSGKEPARKCCCCFEGLYIDDKAYKVDGLYYCEDCFMELMREEYIVTINDNDIELPDCEDD